jgi:uncharacterized protein YbcI
VAAQLSGRIIRLVSQYTGRGPTTARTTLNTNFAAVVLDGTLTKGERNLVAAGEEEAVRRQRETFHRLMRGEAVEAAEELTGRRVRACLTDVSPEEDVAAFLFLFDPWPETGRVVVAETADAE